MNSLGAVCAWAIFSCLFLLPFLIVTLGAWALIVWPGAVLMGLFAIVTTVDMG